MRCTTCRVEGRGHGKDRHGAPRFRCPKCRRTWIEPKRRLFGDMLIPEETGLLALTLLVNGNSVRGVARVTGLHKVTILKLLRFAGDACERFMTKNIKGVEASLVECDETFGYVGMKERTKKKQKLDDPRLGDAYCFLALAAESKLVLAWHLGRRTNAHTDAFAEKLAKATAGHLQISTDQFPAYPDALNYHLGSRSSLGTITKEYGYHAENVRQYAPPKLIKAEKAVVYGSPNPKRISTSYVERFNMTLRNGLKRMTRLTIAFSRCWENHRASLALFIAAYNYTLTHTTLRMPPAMKAGLTTRPWTLRDLLEAATA